MQLFYKFISYLLHPLLFSFLGTFLYLYLSPEHMVKKQEYIILLIVFVSTYIIPILLLSLLKKVKLIEDYQLRTIEERKFPILFFIILSFLIGRTLLNIGIVDLLAFSFFGTAFGLSLVYLLFALGLKSSLHMLGIGGIIGFVAVMSFEYQLNFNALLASLFLVAGLIGVARLSLEAHTPKEIYAGFLVGALAQWLGYELYLFV
jgi:MFS family permease